METAKKIKMALAYADMKQADLARKMDLATANLSQRLKRDLFTVKDMEEISEAIGAKFECYIVFPDGTKF